MSNWYTSTPSSSYDPPLLYTDPILLPCWGPNDLAAYNAGLEPDVIGPAYVSIGGVEQVYTFTPYGPTTWFGWQKPVRFGIVQYGYSDPAFYLVVLADRYSQDYWVERGGRTYEVFHLLPSGITPTSIAASCTLPEPQERCEKGCIEIVRPTDDAYICICKDTDGPTLAPIQNRISKATPPERYYPPARPPRTAIQKTRQQYQQRAPKLNTAKSNYETAAGKAIDNPTQANLNEANNALWPYGNLQRQQDEAAATINANTTEQERSSGVIVTGGRSINRPTINSPIKVGPIVVQPTINRGISLSQTQIKSEQVEE